MKIAMKTAAYFEVGDIILWGKYKNKKGKIVRFGDDGKGNPTVEIEPIPKGKKQNKTLGLFKIWKQKDVEKTASRVAARFATTSIASRVASRVMTAEVDVKIQDYLLAARKKSTGKLESLPKVQALLAYLGGWRVEPFVGLVDMDSGSKGRIADSHNGDVNQIEKQLEALQVSSLPSNPKVDQVYVQNLQRRPGRDEDILQYKLWVGAAGVRYTSPEGKVYELLPDAYSIEGGTVSNLPWQMKKLGLKNAKVLTRQLYKFFPWLYKETGFMDQVLKALEMPSVEEERERNNQVRTRDNTGSCSVCGRNIKLKMSGDKYKMVDHGYRRPGHGYQEGNCFGVPYPPFEISAEGTKAFVAALKQDRQGLLDLIQDIESGKIKKLHITWGGPTSPSKLYQEGDEGWPRAKEKALGRHKNELHEIERALPQFEKAVASWKPRELPKEGDILKALFTIK